MHSSQEWRLLSQDEEEEEEELDEVEEAEGLEDAEEAANRRMDMTSEAVCFGFEHCYKAFTAYYAYIGEADGLAASCVKLVPLLQLG